MIVRTYGRRSREGISTTLSDSLDDNDAFDPYTDSFSSQEAPLDIYAFSSQGSTHFDSDPAAYADPSLLRKAKKKRKGEAKGSSRDIAELGLEDYPMLRATSTLMETQEFGEMMEHVDEVNFALDGLRKGQPVRIKRASLLSLLGICGTPQQRRLLRTHGMVKTIIDSVVGLSLDDSPSNLAAATLFYVFISDGQDELLLESSSCIRFLIKLLNPVISRPAEDRNPGIGSKLLRLRKDAENLCGRDSKSDRNSTIIVSRVTEILCSCKELKSTSGDDSRTGRPELSPKWIALLAMEKASFSTVALEETTGIIRKTGGNFKEKLREFGGLDAVFEVATHCHSVLEEWGNDRRSSSSSNAKDDVHRESLLLFLKFLKIMENATFLSKDNQNYLLQMRGKRDSRGSRLSFTKLLLSTIEILSGLFLDKRSFASGLKADLSTEMNNPAETKADGAFSIRSFTEHCSIEGSSSQRSDTYRDHHYLSSSSLSHSTSSAETKPSSTNDSYLMKANFSSASASRLSGETSKSSATGGTSLIRNGLKNFGKNKKSDVTRVSAFEFSEHVEDPFAFDEEECEPSKWEVLSGKKVQSKNKTNALVFGQAEAVSRAQQQIALHGFDDVQQSLLESSTSHETEEISYSHATDEEHCILIADCLLSAVKVLMNLTNENPVGCRQIAGCGGLEAMASVIACHYPSFSCSSSSASSLCEIEEYGVKIEFEETLPNKQQFSDQEMDLLVAILGLLVNLVEKDDNNRSRLAKCSASVRRSQGGCDYEVGSKEVIPLLCSIFLAHRSESETGGEEVENLDAEEMMIQGEKEAEKMIVEAYAALLLAFLSTESKSTRSAIAGCLPDSKMSILIPVLEKFVAFHLTLEMMTPETHKIVIEVIESLRIP